ncbi:MAG: short chain dehydrogenase [Burkholderiales bacterium]|nr:short chain dehydrogenase [Burkholderiales bacterium]
MRILIIGGTGTIGKAIAAALAPQHEVLVAARSGTANTVDIEMPESIRTLMARIGRVDAIVSAAGQAAFRPLPDLSDEDFALSLRSKMMGQVNVIRFGLAAVVDGGSITLTSGTLAQDPIIGGAAISLVNAGLEGFGRAAALEAPRRVRVNAVSPGWVTETLLANKMDPTAGTPAATVAHFYVQAIEGKMTGQTIVVRRAIAG